MRAAFTSTATHPWRPPYTAITRVIQYSVPVKYTTPVASPSANARRNGDVTRGVRATLASATSSGVSAIHANAGCPYFGKLSARRMPEKIARAKSYERVSA
jgi:hypothetical protein